MNALAHLLDCPILLHVIKQTLELYLRISHLETIDVELVLEEYSVVFNHPFLSEIAPNLITYAEYCFDYFFLVHLVL